LAGSSLEDSTIQGEMLIGYCYSYRLNHRETLCKKHDQIGYSEEWGKRKLSVPGKKNMAKISNTLRSKNMGEFYA
jgi:hypothetical protein